MPFGLVSGVGRRMGVLDGVIIVEGERAVLGVKFGRYIVTSGDGDALFPNYFERTCWRYVALVVVLWRPALSSSSASASVTALR